MAGQNAPPAQDQTGSLDFLWGAVAIIVLALIIWFVFKNQLVIGISTLKLWELKFASLYSEESNALIPLIEFYINHPEQIDFPTVKSLMTDIGKLLSIPFAIICVILAAIVYFGPFAAQYRHIYNMKTLYASQKNLWPQILPTSRENLLETPITEGPWAMSLNPMEFAKKHHLIREVHEQGSGEKLVNRGMKIRAEIRREKAERVFAAQLGEPFENINKLQPYIKALYAAFLARANHDRSTSAHILNALSLSSAAGKINVSVVSTEVKEVFKKYGADKRAAKINQQHAYVRTLMASMLEFARTDGVLSNSDFLWLKPLDRTLWYTLCNVGRQTAFCEVGGIFAHWVVERELKRRFSAPMVQEAIAGLEKAMTLIIYQPEEKE